jgi:hypothetical protein
LFRSRIGQKRPSWVSNEQIDRGDQISQSESNREPLLESVNSLLIIYTPISKSFEFLLNVLNVGIMTSRPRIASRTRYLVITSLTFGKRISSSMSFIIDQRLAILVDGALPSNR